MLDYPDLPRSYAYCLQALRRLIRSLPRNDLPLRRCNRAVQELSAIDVGKLEGNSLHRFVNDCQVRLGELHEAIEQTWFRAG